MHVGTMIIGLGVFLSVLGAVVELVAMLGVASYTVRKALPVNSPIALQSIGGICFFVGLACAAFGGWLTP